MERGVKVKWPSKRMSVGDMNKRVRALVEWVGREQASALDRDRRREALENQLKNHGVGSSADDGAMVVDDAPNSTGHEGNSSTEDRTTIVATAIKPLDKESSASTMKQMEELMEELIGFQERFGPGAKTRDRRLPGTS